MCIDGMTIHPLWSKWIGAYWHKHIVENLVMHTTSYTLQQPSNSFCLGNLSHPNCSSLGTQWCKNHAKSTPYMNFQKLQKLKLYIYIYSFISFHIMLWNDVTWCGDVSTYGHEKFPIVKKNKIPNLVTKPCLSTN